MWDFLNDNDVTLVDMDGYNLVCQNRSQGTRGGVAMYVVILCGFYTLQK